MGFSIVVSEKGQSAPFLVMPMSSNEVTIGRVPDNDVCLPRPNIGKRHARVVLRAGQLIVADLKSTNGTYVNGRRITSPRILKSGDKLAIGDFTLRFIDDASGSLVASPATAPAPAVRIPDDAIRTRAPVSRATVFEDRAEITRVIDVTLTGASATVVFDDVTPLTSEALTFVHVAAHDGGDAEVHVDDVRVARQMVSEGDDTLARRREHEEKLTRARMLVDERVTALTTLDERMKAAQALARAFALHTSVTAGQASLDPAWVTRLDELFAELSRLAALKGEAREALDEAKRAHDDVVALVRSLSSTMSRPRADLVVRLSGGPARVRVTASSVVPCALWRPAHDALLARDAGSARVALTTLATVWQKTGEAWDDVELTFSTARPSAGAKLPSLDEDRLTTREKTAEERRTVVVEHRQETVPRHEGEGTAPGVDDGGEPRVYRATSRMRVPTDGRPHQVELARFDAAATVERVCVPERAPSVFWRASFVNQGRGPILAGPVTLKERGIYAGTGDVLYVGAGETIDLGFGSDDLFSVRHERRRVVQEKLVGKDEVVFVSETTISSMSDRDARITVLTRFPVSEVDKVTVVPSLPHCTYGAPALDEHGLARIVVDVPARSTKTLSLGFHFKTSGDVALPDPW